MPKQGPIRGFKSSVYYRKQALRQAPQALFFFNFLFFLSAAGQDTTAVPVWEQNMECSSLLTERRQMNSIYSSVKIGS